MIFDRFMLRNLCILTGLLMSTQTIAHEGDHDSADHHHHPAAAAGSQFTAAGQDGQQTFDWVHRGDLGQQPAALIEAARGGLHNSADEDPRTGEVVTVVAGFGLITLDRDLQAWTLVENQDEIFAGGMNAHGAVCFERQGESYWAFASTNTKEVVVSRRGTVVAVLSSPGGGEFDHPGANQYYAGGGAFVPCDVTYEPSTDALKVCTGYSPGDYVVTASFAESGVVWGGAAFGGKTSIGGPFSTAHGIDAPGTYETSVLEIASRSHGKLFGFTPWGAEVKLSGSPEGQYHIDLPDGSTPCDVCTVDGQRFIPLLNALPGSDSAAVLTLSGGEVSGQLVPADYDGLQYLRHMHGVRVVKRDDKLFLIALTWPNGRENAAGDRNDGQIAIFEAVAR